MDHLLQHSISIVVHDFSKYATCHLFMVSINCTWIKRIPIIFFHISIITQSFLLVQSFNHVVDNSFFPFSSMANISLILHSMFRSVCFPKTQRQLTAKSRNYHTVSILRNYLEIPSKNFFQIVQNYFSHTWLKFLHFHDFSLFLFTFFYT